MQAFYIDVYFLINFTVDTLAIYFAARFSDTTTGKWRVLLGATLGSLSAIAIVLAPENVFLKILLSSFALLIISFVSVSGIGIKRRIRFTIAFLIFCALIGGGVNFAYGMFDFYIGDSVSSLSGSVTNRRLLLLAVIVLLSIGVFKMIVAFFSGKISTGSSLVEIKMLGKTYAADALIDSANLAFDPMDMCPVMLIKKCWADNIFPDGVYEISDVDKLSDNARRRVRLIPVSSVGGTRVLLGMRPDDVFILNKKSKQSIKVIIAIDSEGGSYGGYPLLIPTAALSNVQK